MNKKFEELLSTIPQDQNLLRGIEEAIKQGAVLQSSLLLSRLQAMKQIVLLNATIL